MAGVADEVTGRAAVRRLRRRLQPVVAGEVREPAPLEELPEREPVGADCAAGALVPAEFVEGVLRLLRVGEHAPA